MVKNWRASLNQNRAFAAVLTDLSEAFDCLLGNLLIANFLAYSCDICIYISAVFLFIKKKC